MQHKYYYLMMLVLLASAGNTEAQPCSNLFFNAYVEGSYSNKAISLFNPTADTLDLERYRLIRISNGNCPGTTFLPIGKMKPMKHFIISHPGADSALLVLADTQSYFVNHNGDDAYVLFDTLLNDTIDIFGEPCIDPGKEWLVGSGSTREHTLVRKPELRQGELDWSVSVYEWDLYPQDSIKSLAYSHPMLACGSCSPSFRVNPLIIPDTCQRSLGSIIISIEGGNPPYQVQWDHGPSSKMLTQLAAGDYYIEVLDQDSCFIRDTITIREAVSITLRDSMVAETCFGDTNGFIQVNASGGLAPYDFQWSSGDTFNFRDSLTKGTYNIIVQDQLGCVTSASYDLPGADSAFVLKLTAGNASCGQSDAFVTAQLVGGVLPYNFKWSSGASIPLLYGVPAGVYTITITDSLGCQLTDSIQVVDTSTMSIIFDAQPDICGIGMGAVEAIPMRGTPPYEFEWSNGWLTERITDLFEGAYGVTVRDSTGCALQDTVHLTGGDSIELTLRRTPSKSGATDGKAVAEVYGGTPPFSISWSNGHFGDSIDHLAPGPYWVSVEDSNQCVNQRNFNIDMINLSEEAQSTRTVLSPTPAQVGDCIQVLGLEHVAESIRIIDLSGNEVHKSKPSQQTNHCLFRVPDLQHGIYIVELVSEDFKLMKRLLIVP